MSLSDELYPLVLLNHTRKAEHTPEEDIPNFGRENLAQK